jgi:Transcriptional activator of glycolytic enzymes
MSRSIKSVTELADEWWVPHGAHNTCVAQMEERWGPRWRQGVPDPTMGKRKNTKSKFFLDRNIIIEEVERRAEAKASSESREVTLADRKAAAKQLDEEQQSRSLAALQESLRGERFAKKRRLAPDEQQDSTTS